jgi:hypothetical protein
MFTDAAGQYGVRVMTPDNMDDGGSTEADRRDNRRAIVVAVIAAIIVGIACFALMAGHGRDPGVAAPTPTSDSRMVSSR